LPCAHAEPCGSARFSARLAVAVFAMLVSSCRSLVAFVYDR